MDASYIENINILQGLFKYSIGIRDLGSFTLVILVLNVIWLLHQQY